MASTRLDFEVNLDDSNFTSRLSAMRSNLSMMFGTAAGDFGGAMSGLAQFGGAATAAYGMMRGGLGQQMGVGTATDPAMAYSMHHGVLQAQSTLGQELTSVGMHPLGGGGPAAFAGMTPPGVGAADYTRMLQRNFAQRMTDTAMGAAGGAAGVAVGMGAWGVAGAAAKALGAGTIAGLAIPFGVSMAAEAIVSGGIERGNKIFGEVQDLGRIATAGRGMSLADTHQFGRGFRSMASRMGISTGEARDIIAGIRQSGMMPETRDVQQSLSQFESMARDIRDISVGMQTSLATATRYLKDVERLGMGRGAGGVFAASGMAGQLGTSLGGLISYVGAGQRMGMATGIGAGAGGQLALGSAFAGAAGMGSLTGGEQRMVGGALGLGRAFQMQAMQNALGPWGQIQGMAMMGPTGAQPLPGTMMGTISQAAGNIFGGGDPIANMVEFTTGRSRMLGQLGGRGIRMMQAQAIQTQANMLQELSPGLTQQRALQFVGMQSGLSEHQARAMAGFIQRGFRDPRPSSRAIGMPAVFSGGGGAAIRAAREGYIREDARQMAEASKMPWTRAIEGIGNWWSGVRERAAERFEGITRSRQVAMGIATPTPEALAEAHEGFRRGTGMLASAGINLEDMGTRGGAAMQTVLAFGGASGVGGTGVGISMPGGRVITAAAAREAMEGIGTQLGRLSRGSIDQSVVTEAAVVIGTRMEQNKERFETTAKNLRWNTLKATGGSADPKGAALTNLTSDIGFILKGTEFEKGFKKQGVGFFKTGRGAEAMAVIDRFMGAQKGGKWQGIGRALTKAGALAVGAAALSMQARGTGLIKDLLRGRVYTKKGIEKRASQIIKEAKEESKSARTEMPPRMVKVPTQKEALVLAKKEVSIPAADRKNAQRILRSRSFREYVKSSSEENRAAVIREARASTKPGASEVAKAMLKNMEASPGITKKLADAVDVAAGESKPKKRRRRRRGRVVAFQSQQESFQSQVATALKKTTHVLDKLSKAIPAGGGKAGVGRGDG